MEEGAVAGTDNELNRLSFCSQSVVPRARLNQTGGGGG